MAANDAVRLEYYKVTKDIQVFKKSLKHVKIVKLLHLLNILGLTSKHLYNYWLIYSDFATTTKLFTPFDIIPL